MFCVKCGKPNADIAQFCHSCGQALSPTPTQPPLVRSRATNQSSNAVRGFVGIILAAGAAWFFFGGGLEHQAAKDMNRIEQQVAEDAVKQYEIAKRSGTSMDACVHAGLVSAAYVQAKDESNYQRWKAIEKSDCAIAGVQQ